ncbi:MAG: hypothetical protein ACRDL6_00640 [Solirubrobacterales bacterium]
MEVNPGRMAQTRLRKLEAEETHARQRVELYRARSNGSRPTDPGRLKELERLFELAQSRVAEARTRG